MDLVGPLPPSRGFIYLLTIVDRYSRFAKLGGEMISLSVVEAKVQQAIKQIQDKQSGDDETEGRRGGQRFGFGCDTNSAARYWL